MSTTRDAARAAYGWRRIIGDGPLAVLCATGPVVALASSPGAARATCARFDAFTCGPGCDRRHRVEEVAR